MIFTVEIDLPGTEDLLKGLNLEEAGKVQRFFTLDVMRRADKYVPFETGVLKNSVIPSPDYAELIYSTPYAQYMWFGKLMVDPITGKGAFHDPISGRFWSRPNTPKVLTDIDLNYNEAPQRGAFWIDRMWEAEGNEIIREVEDFITLNKTI